MSDGHFRLSDELHHSSNLGRKAVATSITDEGERSPENRSYDVTAVRDDGVIHILYYAILQQTTLATFPIISSRRLTYSGPQRH